MSMQNFVSFKKYPDAAQAREVEQLLLDNGILCLFIDNGASVDVNLGGGFLKDYEIKLQQEDFERADAVLLANAGERTSNVPADYYLFAFSDEELYKVLQKKDEWSEFDYMLAQKILKRKGRTIDEAKLAQLEKERLKILSKPENLHVGFIIAGYIFSVFCGFFGILTGYMIYTAKKSLPDGSSIYAYRETDRRQGKIIFYIGIATFIIYFLKMFMVK